MHLVFKLALVSAVCTSPCLYADEELDKLFAMSIEELLQVEISGSTRTNESLLDVPSSVTVFTAQDIQQLGANSLYELINFVPGFQARKNGEASTKYSTAGRGHESNRHLLVLLDGHRLNSEYVGSINSFFDSVPLDNIERVEFIRGAGSAVYGSNAYIGVINLITKKDETGAGLRFSKNASQASASLALNEEEYDLSLFIKGVNDSGQKYSDITDTLGNGKNSAYDPYESFDFQVFGAYKNFELSYIHNERHLDDFYILQELSYLSGDDSRFDSVSLSYDLQINDNFDSKLILAYMDMKNRLFGELSNQSFPFLVDVLRGKGVATEKTKNVEWINTYEFSDENRLIVGAEFRHSEVQADNQSNYDIVGSFPFAYDANYFKYEAISPVTRKIYGLYGQYQSSLSEQVKMTLGLRYDDYSDFGSSLNPRVTLVYQPLEKTSLKLLYAQAFRAPSISQLYLKNNPVIKGNSDLDAETIKSYEAILVQQFTLQTFQVSYYENHMSDIIENLTIAGDLDTYRNGDKAVYKGVDFEYLAEVHDNLTLRATYSYVFEKPASAAQNSEHIASGIINYSWNKFNFNTSGYYHHAIDKDASGTFGKMPSYFIANAKFAYEFYDNASFYLQANNLLDKKYFTPEPTEVVNLEVPNRGRELFVGLEVGF